MTRSLLLLSLSLGAVAACSGSKLPHGMPPPEYEDPPAPSWLKDGGAPAPPPPPGILDAPPPPPATPPANPDAGPPSSS